MYNNAGGKIKGLATVIVAIGMIASVILGIVAMFGNFFAGLLTAAIGCLSAWLSGLMMAAFGELVENSYKILQILSNGKAIDEPKAPEAPAYAKVSVSPADISDVMQRDGVGYGEAMMTAKREKMAAPVPAAKPDVCPGCGAPRKGNGAFCGFCGTKL